jgi:hypothetical protein
MTILTRIKNNQITDNTIEFQKIKSGTLVGTNFNANLTLNSNVTILGNLTVANSFAQLNSINTYINDPVVVFNNNYTGSPTYDIGILVNRNLSTLAPYGAVNAAFVWKEADSAFNALMTTETGTTAGAINNSGFANVKLGNLTAVTANVTGSLNIVGATTFNTIEVTNLARFNGNVIAANTVYITNTTASDQYTDGALVVTGGVGIGGNVNVYGNITTATGNIITTSSGIFYGAIDTGFGAVYAGVPSGYTVLPNTITQFTANADTYAQINFQNINGGSSASTDFVATANNGTDGSHYINMGINSNTYNDPEFSAFVANDGYLYVRGDEEGGNLVVGTATLGGDIKFISGGTDAANIVAVMHAKNTQSTSATTGTFVVTGGTGISQNLTVGGLTRSSGNIVAASGTTSDSTTTGALVVVGGAGVSGNLNIGSKLNVTGATVLSSTLDVTGITTFGAAVINNGNIVAASGTTSTNTTTGALVVAGGAGVSGSLNIGDTTSIAGITSVTNATASTTSANGALVVTGGAGVGGNLNVGGSVVITGDLTVQGNTTTLNTSVLDVEDLNITVAKGAASAAAANGAGLTVDGASATLLYTSATDSWNINKQLIGTGAQFANTTVSTSPVTGALVVAGGVGIGGDLYAYKVNATHGNITTLAVTSGFSSGNAAITGAQTYIGTGSTLIANVYAGTGYFTNLSTPNLSVATGNFTTLYATNFSTPNAQIVNSTVSGILTVSNTTTSTDRVTGAVQVSGGVGIAGTLNAGNATFASINNTPIGNATPAAATFTTAVTTGVLISAGNIVGNSGTVSDSTSTGALVLSGIGGLGVGGKVYTGDTITAGGNIVAASGTNSTSTTTGAVVVQGGLGVMANVFVGGASTFNSNMTAGFDTIIKGNTDETLLWARAGTTYDQVLIGNSATAGNLVSGAKLIINSSDSMILPVGTNAQRPSNAGGTDTQGMFRYNTTVAALEIYDGAEWDQITTQFTVIVSEQFTGDDTTTVFEMAGTSTTAASIVSINGVIQLPSISYSVAGSTLTFTEAPANGDLIDVRRLATTSIVQGIASTNGYMQVQTDNNGVYIFTGATSTSPTTIWNTAGAEVNQNANILAVTDNTAVQIDNFSISAYSSAEYTVTSTIRNTNIREVAKILAVHNNTTATITTYGVVSTAGNSLTSFTANIVGGNVKLYASTTNENTVIRVDSVYQAI